MKRIEAYRADDGTLHDTPKAGARADYMNALRRYRAAHQTFSECWEYLDAPRARIRTALKELYGRLRTLETCLSDLDYHDEDPSDPRRIEEAAKEAKRAAKSTDTTPVPSAEDVG